MHNKPLQTYPKHKSIPPRKANSLSIITNFSWWDQKKVPPRSWSGCLITSKLCSIQCLDLSVHNAMCHSYLWYSHSRLEECPLYDDYPELMPIQLPIISFCSTKPDISNEIITELPCIQRHKSWRPDQPFSWARYQDGTRGIWKEDDAYTRVQAR